MAKQEVSRDKQIVRTSVIGILANVLLAAFKAVLGILSSSIAITLDAVNNLSDAISSVITIIGVKLAGKRPDKKHPYGHGRVEYLTAAIISIIVLYAGITSLVESVKKIIHPDQPDYSTITLVIIAVAVVVKIVLGTYVKKTGERVNSDSLIASGSDARFDAIISAATLAAALIFLTTGLSLEAWLGAVISIVIIKSGIEMLGDTLSNILGKRPDAELAQGIRKTVLENPIVEGAYDLILNDYGPGRYIGSIHVAVPDDTDASVIDQLTRKIQKDVYSAHDVILTAVGVYSINTRDKEITDMRTRISKIVHAHPEVRQIHGFYVDKEEKSMRFDVIIDYDTKNREEIFAEIQKEVQAAYPDYQIAAVLDVDAAD